jgi:TolB-like protein/DNA-binding SARP family transcriptional activator
MNVDISVLETRIKEPAHWSLRLFGGFELSVLATGGRVASLGRRERALLTYLALSPKGRQPRRKLATLIWAEAQDQALLENLRTCLWRLRKALGDTEHSLIASEDEDIVLDTAAFDVDALNFEGFAALSGRTELEAAAHLYGGTFLDGFELDSEDFESWRRAEASRYLDKAVDVLSLLMKLLTECGETERAIETGTRILRLEPLHEATARHLMQLYAKNGRRGTAIQLYRTLTKALRRDVNAQPEAETRRGFALIAPPGEEQSSAPASVHDTPPRRRTKVGHTDVVPTVSVSTARFPLGLSVVAAFIGIAIIAGVALTSFWWLTPGHVGMATRTNPMGNAADSTGSTSQTTAVQIAVLPFDNLSGDPAQQFFSDGMTEEIAAALAKVPRLQLIARSPGLQLKDGKDVRRVGQTLGVRYVIKGSVRKTQNRVRITAQLIRTGTGVIVWSDSYDREITDVFLVQEDIATAIAKALSMSLGLASGERLVSSRNVDPQSYEQFLRARPLTRARFTGVPEAIKILEPLVARNPDYAPAWALLASCYVMVPAFGSPYEILERRQKIEQYWPKAEAASRRAIQLDPNLADAYSSLANLEMLRGRPLAAEDLISKALALDSHNPDALALHMHILSNVGLKKEALATAQRIRALEPYVPTWNMDAAEILWENERYDTAIKIMKSLIERPTVPASLAMMYASLGRYNDAADVLETALNDGRSKFPGWENQWDTAAALLRIAPAKAVLRQNPPRLQRASFAYLYVGAPDHALDYYEDTIKSGLIGGQGNLFGYLWHASYAPIRKTERFKAFLRNAGIVDYWQQRRWPDLCRPKGADDFVCD